MKRKQDKYIAIFSAYIPPHVGGIERYVINLVKQFNKLGYKSIVVTSNYNNDKDIEETDFGMVIRLPIYNVFKNRYPIIKNNKIKKDLMKELDKYNIVSMIVNTRFHLTSHVGVKYANKKNIPVYLIEHGSNYITLDNKFIDFFANRYEDLLTLCIRNKIEGFYGVSNACSKWLKKLNITANGTWYNSIDTATNAIEKKKHKEINFLYAGRIIRQKGVYNILVSFKNLLLKYDNIHLYIAGDGAELDDYKEKFINDRIHFLGKLSLDELNEYYSICDVFLYPTNYPEGLPTSILEAGLMNCAVIGTDRGGVVEIIADGKNGMIVPFGVDDLEFAMDKLINDKKLREKLATELYVTVNNKFSWEVTAKKILKDMNLK